MFSVQLNFSIKKTPKTRKKTVCMTYTFPHLQNHSNFSPLLVMGHFSAIWSVKKHHVRQPSCLRNNGQIYILNVTISKMAYSKVWSVNDPMLLVYFTLLCVIHSAQMICVTWSFFNRDDVTNSNIWALICISCFILHKKNFWMYFITNSSDVNACRWHHFYLP